MCVFSSLWVKVYPLGALYFAEVSAHSRNPALSVNIAAIQRESRNTKE